MKSGPYMEVKDTKETRMKNNEHTSILVESAVQTGAGYFENVKALPEHQLKVEIVTGSSKKG